MSLSHMAGSVVGGALVVKFVPTPFIVVGIAMALSYGAVRLLIWLVRALIERLSRIEVKWPDLGYRAAKARSRHSKPTSRRLRCEPSPRCAASWNSRTVGSSIWRGSYKPPGTLSRSRVRSFVGDLTSLTRCIVALDSTETVRISC